MGIGAVATLTAGLLAVGCSDGSSGGGGIIGTAGDTSKQGARALPIDVSNVDSDGAGFSPNNTAFQDIRIVFSEDQGRSDGPSSSDGTAIIIFRVLDAGNATHRVLASHYSGGNVTQPVELQAEDRNEAVATNIQAVVAIQLGTAAYGTASSTAVNDVRANNGNWLILWDYTTLFQDPRLALNSTTAGAVGVRRTFAATVFLAANRGVAFASSTKVGAVARNFRFGFQEIGLEVPTVKTGAVTAHTVAAVAAPVNFAPRSNVTSFGLISDGFVGQTSFGGDTLPLSDGANLAGQTVVTGNAAGAYVWAHPNQTGATLRNASYQIGERTNFIHLFYTQVVNSLAGIGTFVQPAGANDGGADLAAFTASFNMATLTFGARTELTPPAERNPTGSALKAGTAFYPSFHCYNNHIFFKYADASLITNNVINSDLLSLSPTAAQPLKGLARIFAHEGKTPPTGNGVFHEDIIAYATVADAGDGTSTFGANNHKRDLNLHGTAGAHDLTNPSQSGGNQINTLPNREIMNFNGGGAFIFGTDSGLGDTTIFYLAADSTRAAGLAGDLNPTNVDATLVAAVINNDGALTTGVNPRRVSVHKGDFLGSSDPLIDTGSTANASTDNNTLQDPLVEQGSLSGVGGALNGRNGAAGAGNGLATFQTGNVTALVAGAIPTYFRSAVNRTGEYIALNWIQDQGQSSRGGTVSGSGFYQALFCTVYQTFRPTTSGTGVAVPSAAVEARFAAPQEVSVGTGTLALSQNIALNLSSNGVGLGGTNVQANGPETNTSWTGLPVNWSSFQGSLGYRTGFQSNNRIMNMFWEQSDGTEDRLFTRDLTVVTGATGTPTFTLGTAAEFDSVPSVVGHESVNRFAGAGGNTAGPATGSIDTFRFLDGGIYNFASTDLGPDATAVSANNQGGVLVVLAKVIDSTTSDNDLADGEVVAFEVLRGQATISAANRSTLSRNINENATAVGLQQGGQEFAPGTLTQFNSTNTAVGATYNAVFDTGRILQLISTPRNTTIAGTLVNHSPTRVDVIFTDSRTDNNSGATVLFARKYDSKDRGLAAPKANAGERFNPVGSVGATAPVEPTRLDRLQGGNVTAIVATDQVQSAVQIFWTQDGHLWAQYTADGINYQYTALAPTPPLVDDNNSQNIVSTRYFRADNANGDVSDAIIMIEKRDQTSAATDTRIYLRPRALP